MNWTAARPSFYRPFAQMLYGVLRKLDTGVEDFALSSTYTSKTARHANISLMGVSRAPAVKHVQVNLLLINFSLHGCLTPPLPLLPVLMFLHACWRSFIVSYFLIPEGPGGW